LRWRAYGGAAARTGAVSVWVVDADLVGGGRIRGGRPGWMTFDGLEEVKGADGKGERVERQCNELAGGRAGGAVLGLASGAVRLVRGVVRPLAGYPKVPNLFDAR
jgi:hypothetical protein